MRSSRGRRPNEDSSSGSEDDCRPPELRRREQKVAREYEKKGLHRTSTGATHPDLRHALERVRNEYAMEVSQAFQQQPVEDSQPSRPVSRAQQPAKPGTTEHHLTVVGHDIAANTIQVTEEDYDKLLHLKSLGEITVKPVLPTVWRGQLIWEDSKVHLARTHPSFDVLDATTAGIRITYTTPQGQRKDQTMELTALEYQNDKGLLVYTRPVTKDHGANRELLRALSRSAEDALERQAADNGMLNHDDFKLGKRSLQFALDRIQQLLGQVRAQEKARLDFVPDIDPEFPTKWNEHPKGPNKEDSIFHAMQTSLYLSTGFKTGRPMGPENPSEDGMPPQGWTARTFETPDWAKDLESGPMAAAEAAAEPPPDISTTEDATAKKHLSKKRRDRLSRQTENLFKGIYTTKEPQRLIGTATGTTTSGSPPEDDPSEQGTSRPADEVKKPLPPPPVLEALKGAEQFPVMQQRFAERLSERYHIPDQQAIDERATNYKQQVKAARVGHEEPRPEAASPVLQTETQASSSTEMPLPVICAHCGYLPKCDVDLSRSIGKCRNCNKDYCSLHLLDEAKICSDCANAAFPVAPGSSSF